MPVGVRRRLLFYRRPALPLLNLPSGGALSQEGALRCTAPVVLTDPWSVAPIAASPDTERDVVVEIDTRVAGRPGRMRADICPGLCLPLCQRGGQRRRAQAQQKIAAFAGRPAPAASAPRTQEAPARP